MPINPSDLPWWGWLLCSLGAGLVAVIASAFSDEDRGGCFAVVIAITSGFVGIITGAMAVILFVKWVWNS